MATKLFEPTTLGTLALRSRITMSPMTRNRNTPDNIPTDLMATYYRQRSGAGLIIAEGTSPSPNGVGYPRIPGIYNEAQIEGWKKVTAAVHEHGGSIFLQIMHTGLVSHSDNLPEGARVLGPSAHEYQETKMYSDKVYDFKPLPVGEAMSKEEIEATIEEYVTAAQNAIKAGFDGVELHGANGYLIQQFLNPHINKRTDEFGGSIENRTRFALEVARRVVDAIGKDRVGIRLSPYGVFNETAHYEDIPATYYYLVEELDKLGLAYIHLVDHSAMGAPDVPRDFKRELRNRFSRAVILSGGYGFDGTERAEADLESGLGDLIAFGRTFLANPDLPHRLREGAKLNEPIYDTFYTPGPEGYTDYPVLAELSE